MNASFTVIVNNSVNLDFTLKQTFHIRICDAWKIIMNLDGVLCIDPILKCLLVFSLIENF